MMAIAGDEAAVAPPAESDLYRRGMEHLVEVIQELSLARTMEAVQAIVRRAARALTQADGATFVLKDGPCCFYVDEDAIAPLWKGKRFPLESCISGWAMLNRKTVTIEDIYTDPRIPHDAYRVTFVKSLVMAPIRTSSPIGALGAYWAKQRVPQAAEIRLLQALADSASIAIENVQLYSDLEERVRQRTAELEVANRELESFSYSVSHDLRAPLRAISGFAQAVMEDCGARLDPEGRSHLARVTTAAERMNGLIEALLELSRMTRAPVERETVNVTALARSVAEELRDRDPGRTNVHVVVPEGLTTEADPRLLRVVFENLMNNAWKFTSRKASATIEIGQEDGAFFVRDDGAGFDMRRAERLFAPFQRLCSPNDFPGTGIGLATVLRIVRRHGGDICAESAPGEGTTFRFRLA